MEETGYRVESEQVRELKPLKEENTWLKSGVADR